MTLPVVVAWLLLLGAAVFGLWALYRRPPQVTLSREVTVAGFTDSQVPLTVRYDLRAALPMRLVIEDVPPRSVVAEVIPVISATVFGELHAETRTTLTLNRRGVYDWPGATLHWADPLGLFWRKATLPVATRLEVYPGTHGLLLPEILRPLLSEGALSRTLGLEDPISLRGVRDYVGGDPPGRIHWRLSARTGSLMVRELERTAASSLTVYVDLFEASDVFTESAVRLVASLVQEAQQLDLPLGIATATELTPVGTSFECRRAALRALAEASPTAERGIATPPLGGNLIILTQRAGPELIAQAMRARVRASRVIIVAIPEGFYLEPGEKPRRQWVSPPDTVRELQAQAGLLAESGILVYLLRGNQSVLKLGAE